MLKLSILSFSKFEWFSMIHFTNYNMYCFDLLMMIFMWKRKKKIRIINRFIIIVLFREKLDRRNIRFKRFSYYRRASINLELWTNCILIPTNYLFPTKFNFFFTIGILLTAVLIWIWIFWNGITPVIALIINLFSYFITVFYYNFLHHLTLIDVNIFYIKFHLFNFYAINFYNLKKKLFTNERNLFKFHWKIK